MPLHLAWSRSRHLAAAPEVFKYMWIVSSVALALVVVLCLKKCVQTAIAAYRSRYRREHVFLPKLQEAEISLTLAPVFFAWVGWAAVFDMQTAAVITVLINIVTAAMLTHARDLLVAAIGEEPGVKDLLKAAAPQAWWKTLPCCCLAGVCLTGQPEPLRPKHLRFGKYMVDFFVMVNLINALTQLVALSSISRIEKVDGWCVTDMADQSGVAQVLAQLQGLSAPFAMYAVSVMAKGVVACLSEEDKLQLNTKGNMAGTISLLTGLGPLVANYFAKGYKTPVLAAGDTLIETAVGCPVYDKQVMATMWFAASLPPLMLLFALQLQGLVHPDDAKMAHELRTEQRQKLLTVDAEEESCLRGLPALIDDEAPQLLEAPLPVLLRAGGAASKRPHPDICTKETQAMSAFDEQAPVALPPCASCSAPSEPRADVGGEEAQAEPAPAARSPCARGVAHSEPHPDVSDEDAEAPAACCGKVRAHRPQRRRSP